MIVAQISDTHIYLPEPEGSQRLRDLKLTIEMINLLDPQPDLVIHTGDISHNATEEEYLAAKKLLNKLKAPLFVIPGNRDRREMMSNIFAPSIGKCNQVPFIQYTLDQWDTKIILLDTLDEGDRLGTLCNKRLDDLAHILNADKEKPAAIFMHHPPYDVVEAPEPFQFDSLETLEKLGKILENNSQIQGIYCGHSHRATTGSFCNINALTVPALSIDLRFGGFPESQEKTADILCPRNLNMFGGFYIAYTDIAR